MAPKKVRPSPLEDPPTASSSSSDEDEKQPSSQKPENEEEEDGSSSDEGEEVGSSDDEEEDKPKPASKTSPPPNQSSSSESGSESDPEPTPPPNPKIKPLASKPMKAQPKAQAQPTAVPARSGAKRPIENINSNGNDTKRSKKKTTTATGDDETKSGKISGEDSKKMSQNQIREKDEIAILKGLADFISKTGKDPLKDSTAFHIFVKNSLHGDPTREQLIRKVRRLKTKFDNSDNFTKPHDKKAFELFKKVWGNESNEIEENGKPNEKFVKSPPTKSTKKEAINRNNGSAKKEVATKKESENVESLVAVDDSSLTLREMYRFDNGVGLFGLDKDLAKKGLELMGKSKRVEIEGRWKKLQIAELEVIEQRAQFVKDQTSLALQALRKN